MKSCSRAPVARRSGLKSGVCFPIILGSRVFGTMDFFTEERVTLSESRLDALRNVGRLVSSALERVDQQTKMDQAKKDLETQGQPAHEGGQGRVGRRSDHCRRRSR